MAVLIAVLLFGGTFGITSRVGQTSSTTQERSPAEEQSKSGVLRLISRQNVEQRLSGGRVDSYELGLASSQRLHMLLDQRGFDLVVSLFGPDNVSLYEVLTRSRGPTPGSLITERAGTYWLEVWPAEKAAPSGSYVLEVGNSRPATMRDKVRLEAEQAFAEGNQLRLTWLERDLRKAIQRYGEARSSWQRVGEEREEAEVLRNIGGVYYSLGDAKEALEYYKQALSLCKRVRIRKVEAAVLNDISLAYNYIGEGRKALHSARQALLVSRTLKNSLEEAQALNNIGWAYFAVSQMEQALELFNEALPLRRTLNDRRGQAETLLNLGYTHSVLKETNRALDFYNQALPLWRAVNDRRGEALTLTAIGNLHNLSGERQEALDLYGQATHFFQTMGDRYGEAITLSGFAYTYEKMGEHQKAIEYYTQTLNIFRALDKRSGEAMALNRIGLNHHSLGNYEQALDHSKRALVVSRGLADPLKESYALGAIGKAYESLGKTRKALDIYRRTLILNQRGGDKGREADTVSNIGHVYEALSYEKKAAGYYKQALSLYRQAGERNSEAIALANVARVERDLGNLVEARSLIEDSLKITESLRTNVASQDLRTSFFASVHQRYEFYTDLLMRFHKQNPTQGFDLAALQASERGRARSALETLAETQADIRGTADPALLERESSLQRTLDAWAGRQTRLLSGRHSQTEAAAIGKRISEITTEYEEVKAQIKLTNPRYTALTQPQPASVDEIKELLDKDSLLLEYALGDDRSYLWAVTRTEVSSFELPGRAEIEAAARNVYGLLTANQPIQGETFEQRQARVAEANEQLPSQVAILSRLLLAPVASKLGKQRLIIVPDGALQYIPFQILTKASDAKPMGSDFNAQATPRPLVADHEIVNEPSASALALLLSDTTMRKPPSNSVAVLADPVFELDDPRIRSVPTPDAAAVASQTQRIELQRAVRDVDLTGEGGRIPRLLASRDEAEAIMAVAPWWSALKATGFDASRATAMRPDLSDYRIVHFATHGLLNNEHPALSGVVLSLVDQKGQPQDGFLRLHEIYNLKLPVDLVVLSACSTGLGKDLRGEGLIGLTRGFMYAGAASVVASMWKVDDEATAELMRYFYRSMLRDGLPPAAALRRAQIAMSQQKRWQSPYYWSGFVIQGQYNQTVRTSSFGMGWVALWASVAAVLSLATFVVLKQRRSRVR